MKNLEQYFSDEIMSHINSPNKKVKYISMKTLENFVQALSSFIENEKFEDVYYKTFLIHLDSKLKMKVKKTDEPRELMSCIRCMAYLSSLITQIKGEEHIHNLFTFLIETSQSNLISKFDKLDNFSFEHNTQNFKAVLNNQKQLNLFLKSFALISEQVPKLDSFEIKYVVRLMEMGFKYYLNYFPPHRIGLHESLILCIVALPINITMTLEFSSQLDKLFETLIQSSNPEEFHNLIFFVDLFNKVFGSSSLPIEKKAFCWKLIFEKVVQFLSSNDQKNLIVLMHFFQELIVQCKFDDLLKYQISIFENIINAIEKKIMKYPYQITNFTLFSLLLKIRKIFDDNQINYENESIKDLSNLLVENSPRVPQKDHLKVLECFLNLPYELFNEKILKSCLSYSLASFQRSEKSLSIVSLIVKKLLDLIENLDFDLFSTQKDQFFRILTECLNFQLSLSFEDKMLLESKFDSSLVNKSKFSKINNLSNKVKNGNFKIGQLENKKPMLKKSNLIIFNLGDFRTDFESIFDNILLIFKQFENRSVSVKMSNTKPNLETNSFKTIFFEKIEFKFNDINLKVSPQNLLSLSKLKLRNKLENKYLCFIILTEIPKLKNKDIENNFNYLKDLLRNIFKRSFTENDEDDDLDNDIQKNSFLQQNQFSLIEAITNFCEEITSKKITMINLFIQVVFEISIKLESFAENSKICEYFLFFLNKYLNSCKLKNFIIRANYLIEKLKLFSCSYDFKISQTIFFILLEKIYKKALELRKDNSNNQDLIFIVEQLHYCLIEVFCHDKQLFSSRSRSKSEQIFLKIKTLLQSNQEFFNEGHLMSILKSINSEQSILENIKTISLFKDCFEPQNFNINLSNLLKELISNENTFEYYNEIEQISSKNNLIQMFKSESDDMKLFYKFVGLFLLHCKDKLFTNLMIAVSQSQILDRIIDVMFFKNACKFLSQNIFNIIKEFLLSSKLQKNVFRIIKREYLHNMAVFNHSFSSLRLLYFNLYMLLNKTELLTLSSLFDKNTTFTIFNNIKTLNSAYSKKNQNIKFSLMLTFLCKLGIFDMDFFYKNLVNPSFIDYTKSFCKFLSKLPEQKKFLIVPENQNLSYNGIKNSEQNSGLSFFIKIFSNEVINTNNNDIPAVETFLQIITNNSIKIKNFSNLFIRELLQIYSNQQLPKIKKFFSKLHLIDSEHKESKESIKNFLDSFDFSQENDFYLVWDFFLEMKEKYELEIIDFKTKIEEVIKRTLNHLPYDLQSISKNSTESQKIKLFIEKLIQISFEIRDLSLLEHLFHIFRDENSNYISTFSKEFVKIKDELDIDQTNFSEYFSCLLSCCLYDEEKVFPEFLFHRINVFIHILNHLIIFLSNEYLIELVKNNIMEYIQILEKNPQSFGTSKSNFWKSAELIIQKCIILSLLASTFKILSKDEIQNNLFNQINLLRDSNQKMTTLLMKMIISQTNLLESEILFFKNCENVLEKEKINFVMTIHNKIYKAKLFEFGCSLLLKTQSKLSLVSNLLIFNFETLKSNLLNYVPEMNLNFGVKTNFEIRNKEEFGININKSTKSSLNLSHKFDKSLFNENASIISSKSNFEQVINQEIEIEMDQINEFPLMLYLNEFLEFIQTQFLLEKKIVIDSIFELLENESVSSNKKTFLIKLVLNNPKIFESHKEKYIVSLLKYICSKQKDGKGFHYFLRDCISLFCDWFILLEKENICFFREKKDLNKNMKEENLMELKRLSNIAVETLIKKLGDESKIILNHNILIFKKFLSVLAPYIEFNLSFLFKILKLKTSQNEKRHELKIWKFVVLNVLELFIEENIVISSQNLKMKINSFNDINLAKEFLEIMSQQIINETGILSLKAGYTLGYFLKHNQLISKNSSFNSKVSDLILLCINSKTEKFVYRFLEHFSFEFPEILLQNNNIHCFVLNSKMNISESTINYFLGCIENIFKKDSFEFGFYRREFKIMFLNLINLFDRLIKNINQNSNFFSRLLKILIKFIEVDFEDKTLSLRYLVYKMNQIKISILPKQIQCMFFKLVLTITQNFRENKENQKIEEETNTEDSFTMDLFNRLNDSFKRIEQIDFAKETQEIFEQTQMDAEGMIKSIVIKKFLLQTIGSSFSKLSESACFLMKEIYSINSFENIIDNFFIHDSLQISIKAFPIFLSYLFSMSKNYSLKLKKKENNKTNLQDKRIETPKKKKSIQSKFFEMSDNKRFPSDQKMTMEWEEENFFFNQHNGGIENFNENHSILSFMKMETSSYKSNSFQNNNSSVIRFNESNTKQMFLHFKRKYFVNSNPCQNHENNLDNSNNFSMKDDYSIKFNSSSKNKMNSSSLSVDWKTNLNYFRINLYESSSILKNLDYQTNNDNFLMNSIQEEIQEDLNEFLISNKNLGRSLRNLFMFEKNSSPKFSLMFLKKAFKIGNENLRMKIFNLMINSLQKNENINDSSLKEMISEILFEIFKENKELFFNEEIIVLLLTNQIFKLSLLIINEMVLSTNYQQKPILERKSKRILRTTPLFLKTNISKKRFEESNLSVKEYLKVCKLLKMSQEKWGLFESIFENKIETVNLLKMKEDKMFLNFMKSIQENPDLLKQPKHSAQTNIENFFRTNNNNNDSFSQDETKNKQVEEIEELMQKEVEDSLFSLGKWEQLSNFVEEKNQSIKFTKEDYPELFERELTSEIHNYVDFKPDSKFLLRLSKKDTSSAERYLKSHLYDKNLTNRLILKEEETETEQLSKIFAGELAFHSFMMNKLEEVKFYNEHNKEILKKNLSEFDKSGRNTQFKLIENTNLYVEMKQFMEFKTQILKKEEFGSDFDDFVKKSLLWINNSKFCNFDSCINTFLFRKNIFELLGKEMTDSFCQSKINFLRGNNLCKFSDNLKDLGYLSLAENNLKECYNLIFEERYKDESELLTITYLKSYSDFQKKKFLKTKDSFDLNEVTKFMNHLDKLNEIELSSKEKCKLELVKTDLEIMTLQNKTILNNQSFQTIFMSNNQLLKKLYDEVLVEDEITLLNMIESVLRLQIEKKNDLFEIDQELIKMYFDLFQKELIKVSSSLFKSQTSKRRIPFVFILIKKLPTFCSNLFRSKIENIIPSRLLIGWEQQLIDFLDEKYDSFSIKVIEKMIADFPHLISNVLFFNSFKPVVKNLILQNQKELDIYFYFFQNLFELEDPEQKLLQILMDIKKEILKIKHKNEFIKLKIEIDKLFIFWDEKVEIWNNSEIELAEIEIQFKKFFEKDLKSLIEICEKKINYKEILSKIELIENNINSVFKGRFDESKNITVDLYSHSLSIFTKFFYNKILSLNEDRSFTHLLFPFYNEGQPIMIKSLLPELLTMNSIKRPKRITVLLENNKKRHLLLKFGEDLRTDYRIQKVFKLFNECLNQEHFKDNKGLKRFGVLPINENCGLLEWIEDSQPFSDLIDEGLKKGKYDENRSIQKHEEFLQKTGEENPINRHLKLFKMCDETLAEKFDEEVSLFGKDNLKNAFLKRSENINSYFFQRKTFMEDYALVSVIGYILGIGDRHCQNMLINKQGVPFLIDFACCFGQGLHLNVPELVPFRLTPNIIELMLPFGVKGTFKSEMVKAFKDIISNKQILVDYISIYAEQPTSDWSKLSLSEEIGEKEFIMSRITQTKEKLNMICPIQSVLSDLEISKHKKLDFFNEMKNSIGRIRKSNQVKVKNEEDLVERLIDMSTFKPFLMRMWVGWLAFI